MSHQLELTVDNLKKVSVALSVWGSSENKAPAPPSETLEFIFGIGSQGITPFEYDLANKKKGDVVNIRIEPEAAPSYFAHLGCTVIPHIDNQNELCLQAEILNITLPDNREIIKAMAQRTECGDGCDCGCGCE